MHFDQLSRTRKDSKRLRPIPLLFIQLPELVNKLASHTTGRQLQLEWKDSVSQEREIDARRKAPKTRGMMRMGFREFIDDLAQQVHD